MEDVNAGEIAFRIWRELESPTITKSITSVFDSKSISCGLMPTFFDWTISSFLISGMMAMVSPVIPAPITRKLQE